MSVPPKVSETVYSNVSLEELLPSWIYSKDPSDSIITVPVNGPVPSPATRESESISVSLIRRPFIASTFNVSPSSTEYSSTCPTGASLTGVTVIEAVTVSELRIPSDA